MRILWLSHFLPYPATGHGALQRSHNLLREAAKRHDVHLVAVATAAGHARLPAHREAVDALTSIVTSVRSLPVPTDPMKLRTGLRVATSAIGRASYWESWLWSRRFFQMVREAANSGVDAVHVDSIFLVRYLEAVPDVPFILNHHNIESDLLFKRAELPGGVIRRAFFANEARKVARLERLWAPRAAANVVVSSLDADRLHSVAGNVQTVVVSNGVDVDFFSADSLSANPKHMVFAGGMDWFPNRDAMVYFARDIWPALCADDPQRRMTVIGRNPPAALLEAAAADSRLAAMGFVDDVRPFLREAGVYICPIRTGGGTRLKILDALAMRRPLVSTAVGVEGLDLVDGVHYLRAETPEEFVHQVRRIESDEHLREQLALAGRALVEDAYSWSVIGDRLDEAFSRPALRETRL